MPIARNSSLYLVVDGPLWEDAEYRSSRLGGHLVTINNAEENTFITNNFSAYQWIGINDVQTEGTFVWSSGQPVTYTNWAINQPDDYLGIQDYGILWPGGDWDDNGPAFTTAKGIAEIPIQIYGDSAYTVVSGNTWQEAQANAQALGGNLVTINDASENDWIAANLPYDTWIGINDINVEGVYQWASGEPVTYTNWAFGEPNAAFPNEDYGVMWGGGVWNDESPFKGVSRGLVEIKLNTILPPAITAATVVGTQIQLQFSKPLDTTGLTASRFSASVAGLARSVTAFSLVPGDSTRLNLSISGVAPSSSQNVTLSYADLPDNNLTGVIQDLKGNDMTSVSGLSPDTLSTP